jgi:hypothetical protein
MWDKQATGGAPKPPGRRASQLCVVPMAVYPSLILILRKTITLTFDSAPWCNCSDKLHSLARGEISLLKGTLQDVT